jgi:hypothetical protein
MGWLETLSGGGYNPMTSGGASPGIHPTDTTTIPSGSDFTVWANQNLPGGFNAWQQRQFSSAPFSADDPLNVSPGGTWRGSSGVGAQPWKNPSSWDPRVITGDPNYQRLTSIGQSGSGAPAQARTDVSPAMAYYQKALATGDPLGTQMAPQLAFEQAMQANRAAGVQANAKIDESAGGMNAMSNPAMAQFMKTMGGFQQAQGIGGAATQEANSKIAERSATGQFQKGVADALQQLTGMLAGVKTTDTGLMNQAASGALGANLSATNTWAQLMAELLRAQMQPYQPSQRISPGGQQFQPPGGAGMNPFQLLLNAFQGG